VDEINLIHVSVEKLKSHDGKNSILEAYYEGKNRLKDLGISMPPSLKLIEAVVGWAGTTVDVLEERLDFEGYIGDQYGLNDIFRANELDLESSLGHKDALVYGKGFVFVGKGNVALGEPEQLVTIESPRRATGFYDLRSRRVTSAILVNREGSLNEVVSGSLYLPNETIYFERTRRGWVESQPRDVHNLGRVLVSSLTNNPRSGDPGGRSEITRAVRSITDSAMRTLAGAEIAREFFAAPQRYLMGAKANAFEDADGNPVDRWSIVMGNLLGIEYNDDDEVMPQVGQFAANSPAPFFEQIRQYAQLMSAETAIPASYLGFQTDNPTSADAIRQMEARLVKRAERRQNQFGRTWTEVAKLILLSRDGTIPDSAINVRPVWRDAATPTRAAAADEVMKLISVGVLSPDSEIVHNRIGLSDSDKQVLKSEKALATSSALLDKLATAAGQKPGP
jgi:hypothetical protein